MKLKLAVLLGANDSWTIILQYASSLGRVLTSLEPQRQRLQRKRLCQEHFTRADYYVTPQPHHKMRLHKVQGLHKAHASCWLADALGDDSRASSKRGRKKAKFRLTGAIASLFLPHPLVMPYRCTALSHYRVHWDYHSDNCMWSSSMEDT